MTNVTFYLLPPENSSQETTIKDKLIYYLAHTNWCTGKRILISCPSEKEAVKIDQALWNQPTYSFVPHNLAQQGPSYGAPIEITWSNQVFTGPRNLLINLLPYLINSFSEFLEIIDFAPNEQPWKQLARNRYKKYQSLGYQIDIQKIRSEHI
ncbi:DNA polymerase III subunit chi [Candidatus Erwinia haradaeae]|uniref:DNA polymerase III subunit chi n=1 Tax=Candidatus Erwinia haradaeae TaxID=1922217 RepID=A0A451D8Q4_9GAMM|nr:DNA polymerase III subunit chi [Candidatus Erwinia haradaeae]VFP82231.1 DNA polymerase III subunit chi [Candidatus Erwinia haradaeae]